MRSKHIPYRTCVVCRSKRPKRNLIRMVLDSEGQVMVDPRQRQPGRGAYVCSECVGDLRFDKRIQRAFRGRATGFSAGLHQWLMQAKANPSEGPCSGGKTIMDV